MYLSVCLSHYKSRVAALSFDTACNWVAVAQGSNTALSSKCGQYDVYSQGTRLNRDLLIQRLCSYNLMALYKSVY